MSTFIDTTFVDDYRANVMLTLQQQDSRLSKAVMHETAQGESLKILDQIGEVEPNIVTERHGNTPITDPPHYARWAEPTAYDWGALIDKVDRAKQIINPGDMYARAGASCLRRGKDDAILSGLLGSVKTGKGGSTSTALPTAQKITTAGGMTEAKLNTVLEKFENADVDMDAEEIWGCIGPRQHNELRNIEHFISGDYRPDKPLPEGAVFRALGVNFIVSNRLDTTGSVRHCPFWLKSRVYLVTWDDIEIDVGPRRDKRNATQTYVCGIFGGSRTEEEAVVQMDCTES